MNYKKKNRKITTSWGYYVLVLTMMVISNGVCDVMLADYKVEIKWPGGFEGSVQVPAVRKFKFGWVFYFQFDIPVSGFKVRIYKY